MRRCRSSAAPRSRSAPARARTRCSCTRASRAAARGPRARSARDRTPSPAARRPRAQAVSGRRRIEVARHQAQVRGGELPLRGWAVGLAEGLELLEPGQLAHVHLGRQLAANRAGERLAGPEVAAREDQQPANGSWARSTGSTRRRSPRTWSTTAIVTWDGRSSAARDPCGRPSPRVLPGGSRLCYRRFSQSFRS